MNASTHLAIRVSLALLCSGIVCSGATTAQSERRLESLRASVKVLAAFEPVVAETNRGVGQLRDVADGKLRALATVLRADGVLVSKASELGELELVCQIEGHELPIERIAVVEADDLAFLRVRAPAPLRAIVWAETMPTTGAFVASADGAGAPAAVGVISSEPYQHSLRKGFLGVSFAPESSPPRLTQVQANTAAQAAGLLEDDVILTLDDQDLATPADLVRAIGARAPGDTIRLRVLRGDRPLEVAATLRQDRRGTRSAQERVWGELSELRAGFGTVVQHDTILRPDQCGGPIVDLDGNVIGINIARAGRVETLALPRATVEAAWQSVEAMPTSPASAGEGTAAPAQRADGRQP